MSSYDEMSEFEMEERVCQFFTIREYACERHLSVREGQDFFEFDLACKKNSETVLVEVKRTSTLYENYIKVFAAKLQTYVLSKKQPHLLIKSYICVHSSTFVSTTVREQLELSGIGLIRINREGVEIGLEARSLVDSFWRLFMKTLELGGATPETIEPMRDYWRNIQRSTALQGPESRHTEADIGVLTSVMSAPASLVFSNMMSKYIKTISPGPYKPRISRELLDKISDMHSVGFADLLREFRQEYDNAENSKEEDRIVLKTLEKLWAGKYGKTSGAKAFDSFAKFEPILKATPRYRDHLIHPFQVFLMGSLVIDAHYEELRRIYRRRIQNARSDSLEFSWLLCSTFHDICYPIQMYETFNKSFFEDFLQSDSPVVFQTEKLVLDDNNLKYIDQLVALHAYLGHNNPQRYMWEYDSACKIDASIRSAMMQELTSKNHALLSSIALLKKILNEEFVKRSGRPYLKGRFSTDVYPAALAIAMHEEKMLRKLKKRAILENMPLSFLLVYCDLVQESGRSDGEETAELHSFDCRSKSIESTLIFGFKHDFIKKTQEMERIFKRISSKDLCFSLELRFEGSKRSENTCEKLDTKDTANTQAGNEL